MNVQTFKLLNGDEIIADVSNVGSDFVSMMHPRIFQQMLDPNTQKPAHALLPWPALAAPNQLVQVPVAAMMSMPLDAHEELERQYTMNVSGMVLPPATPKILLG